MVCKRYKKESESASIVYTKQFTILIYIIMQEFFLKLLDSCIVDGVREGIDKNEKDNGSTCKGG